jgi:hypothetical protein
MIRVTVTYSELPDPKRYAEHEALCRAVPAVAFRHGPVQRTLFGTPLAYMAEWEFADEDAFRVAAATDEFKATGTDAAAMGTPHSVYVVRLS